MMKMILSIPALPVRNISSAVVFYCERLGFSVDVELADFARVVRDAVVIDLWAANDESWRKRANLAAMPVSSGAESFLAGTASCRIRVAEIDPLYQEYKDQGVLYSATTRVETQPWGIREFAALDLERNLLTFYQRV